MKVAHLLGISVNPYPIGYVCLSPGTHLLGDGGEAHSALPVPIYSLHRVFKVQPCYW